jgi:hypothetical protein
MIAWFQQFSVLFAKYPNCCYCFNLKVSETEHNCEISLENIISNECSLLTLDVVVKK